jgi:hypothetical protein
MTKLDDRMNLQEMEILVDRDGNVTLHVLGVKGDECTRITKGIEDAIGNVTDRILSGEFYQVEETLCRKEQVDR